MNLSFHEKSLWLMLASLIACFSFYFAQVLPAQASDVMPQQVALFAFAVVLLVVLQIAGQVVIAILERRTGTDERDRMIGLVGTRNGAYVLASGVFFALCTALTVPGNFVFMHVLLGAWVLAQLVATGSQLFLYRRAG